jgi:glycosyltransferase involved in cell wall biosynthesis
MKYLGIDPVFFNPREFDRTHDRYFLYVGNDKPHKNVQALLRAFAVVRQRGPSLGLILAGAAFERFRDQPRVHLAGFVTTHHLAALYRGAIALVIPSLEEGFGLPAAEAMAAGTAVITSTAPALLSAESVRPGTTRNSGSLSISVCRARRSGSFDSIRMTRFAMYPHCR